MKFKTSSFIKSIVGKDLITDPYIAVFELVKNSYDADAHKVIISFNTGEDNEQGFGKINQQGKIYIVDNGHGMSKADLENKWLALADCLCIQPFLSWAELLPRPVGLGYQLSFAPG